MKSRIVDNVTYYPRTYKENGKFFAMISFVGNGTGQTYILTPEQETRSKARTIAINHIKAIKSDKHP